MTGEKHPSYPPAFFASKKSAFISLGSSKYSTFSGEYPRICFTNGLFDIRIAEDFTYDLEIPFDNSEYMQIFKSKVEENGFDYLTVRIYEASLFISMLPLHIDNPHKVLGFILNADRILKEIELDV